MIYVRVWYKVFVFEVAKLSKRKLHLECSRYKYIFRDLYGKILRKKLI